MYDNETFWNKKVVWKSLHFRMILYEFFPANFSREKYETKKFITPLPLFQFENGFQFWDSYIKILRYSQSPYAPLL